MKVLSGKVVLRKKVLSVKITYIRNLYGVKNRNQAKRFFFVSCCGWSITLTSFSQKIFFQNASSLTFAKIILIEVILPGILFFFFFIYLDLQKTNFIFREQLSHRKYLTPIGWDGCTPSPSNLSFHICSDTVSWTNDKVFLVKENVGDVIFLIA